MSNGPDKLRKKAAGIIFTVRHPENKKWYAILHRRQKFNPETANVIGKWGRQSFAGLCQPTVHGKLKAGETVNQAVLRELGEELLMFWVGYCHAKFSDGNISPFHSYFDEPTNTDVDVFHLVIPWTATAHFQEGMSLEFFPLEEVARVENSTFADKDNPITDLNQIVMFEGQRKTLVMIAQEHGCITEEKCDTLCA